MGVKDRLKRLEQRRGPEHCPECGSRILVVEVLSDGSRRYLDGDGPCGTCNNAGVGGAIGVIEVVPIEESAER